MNIYLQQVKIIESLQTQCLVLLQNPNNSVSELLKQLGGTIDSLLVINKCFNQSAVKDLSELVNILFGTNDMTYTPEQIQAAKDRAKVVLDFFVNHQAEMAEMKSKLDEALSDDEMDKAKIEDLQSRLNETQTHLNDFVKEFIDTNSLAETPTESSEIAETPVETPADTLNSVTPTTPSNLV